MADDDVWRAPVLGENGRLVERDSPATITGMLRDAAKPQPLQGTALGLFMTDQELADAESR